MLQVEELTRDVLANEVVECWKLTFDLDPTDEAFRIRQHLTAMRDIIMAPDSFTKVKEDKDV